MKPRRTAKRADENPENIVARLAKKLPEGYEIVNMADSIDFSFDSSSLNDSEPQTKQKEPPPPPPKRHHVVFERDRIWDDDDVEERKARREKQLPMISPIGPGLMWPLQLSLAQIEALSERLGSEWHQLKNAALHASDSKTKEAAGRAVANIVSKVLNSWPEKKTLKTCVSETIKRIKRDNEGFKQRWQKELHLKGVTKKRTKTGDKQLQRFVSNAELRLNLLESEVTDSLFALAGIYSTSPTMASWRETLILSAWVAEIPGVLDLVLDVKDDRLKTWDAAPKIRKLIEQAKVQNAEDYFWKVFRPALEDGFWHKWGDLPEGKFTDWQSVMLTMLKVEIYEQAD